MGLRLIYGRAGSGKSHFCLNDIKNMLDLKGHKPLILVVPEQYSFQAERDLLHTVGNGVIMQAEVLTFRRMAHRVFNEVGGLTKKNVSSAGKCMLIHKILENLSPSLEIFSRASRQQGFASTLSDMISEFKRYEISSIKLQEICDRLDSEVTQAQHAMKSSEPQQSQQSQQSQLAFKLKEICQIYSIYEESVAKKYLDTDDELTILSSKLEFSHQFDGAEFWIDGFAGFTPQEFNVIKVLLQKAKRVNISLCIDGTCKLPSIDMSNVFYPVQKTVSRFLQSAKESNFVIDSSVCIEQIYQQKDNRFSISSELRHLERHFFSPPYKVYSIASSDSSSNTSSNTSSDTSSNASFTGSSTSSSTGMGNIRVFTASNIYSEVEEAARDIIRLCRDNGLRYKDIAVVSRNLDIYNKLVTVIFSEYGIPHFVDSKTEVSLHPVIQMILSVLKIFTDNWSYEAVFSYLKTGLTSLGRDEIDVLENYVLEWGINGNRWTQPEEWDYGSEEDNLERIEKVNQIKVQIVKPLIEFKKKIAKDKKVIDICTALFELICELQIHENITYKVEQLQNIGEMALAEQYRQVWDVVLEVLDQAVEIMGDEACGLERFARILSIGFGQCKIGIIPPAQDQVLVGSIERSKSHQIKALYILGANDGVLPAPGRSEGILSDKEREKLDKMGMELGQSSRVKAFEEQFLIYSTFTTPSQYISISYPVADHEGRTLRPSILVSQIRKMFPNALYHNNISCLSTAEEELEMIAAAVPSFRLAVRTYANMLENTQTEKHKLWHQVFNWFEQDENWKSRFNIAITGKSYSNIAIPVNSDKIRMLLGMPMNTSISRLESYVACPFSFYMKYVIKASERKMFAFNAPDIGTFMHKVIDVFSNELVAAGKTWRTLTKEECDKGVAIAVEHTLSNMKGSIFNSSERYRYLSGRLKTILEKAVWVLAGHIKQGSFEPIGYEAAFGEGANLPPIDLKLKSSESVRLIGRVDRIDAYQGDKGMYLRIIDYKSGTKKFKLSDVFDGLQIQLITYLDALVNAYSTANTAAEPAGMLYYHIDDPLIRAKTSMTDDEIEKSILKKLKMRGLLLADVNIVREMDREINGDSYVIPARINKGEVLGRSSAATKDQFNRLRKHVNKLLSEVCEEILGGNVSIKPYKKKKVTPCTYCAYSSACHFDTSLVDNTYRNIKDMKDNEVWDALKMIEERVEVRLNMEERDAGDLKMIEERSAGDL